MRNFCGVCGKIVVLKIIHCAPCEKVFHPRCVVSHKIENNEGVKIVCNGEKREEVLAVKKGSKVQNVRQKENVESPNESKKTAEESETEDFVKDLEYESEMIDFDGMCGVLFELIDVKINEMKTQMNEVFMSMSAKYENTIGELKKEVLALKNVIVNNNKNVEQKKSYGDVVKANKNVSTFVIKATGTEEIVTEKAVKDKIDIVNLPVGVNEIHNKSNGSMILRCETTNQNKNIGEIIKSSLGNDFSVKKVDGKKPKLKIVGVHEDEIKMSDEAIVNAIKKQNCLTEKPEVRSLNVIKRIKKRADHDSTSGTIIVEVDAQTYSEFVEMGKINLGWHKCKVFDYVGVMRCFKCWGFNHISKYCTNEIRCNRCTGQHEGKNCSANQVKCVNCVDRNKAFKLDLDTNHETTSSMCPVYIAKQNIEKKKINYSQSK